MTKTKIPLPRAHTKASEARWSLVTSRWFIPALLALLPFLLFFPLTLVQTTFYVHDVQHYFYPYHAISAAMLHAGQLPLWNPYAFSGIPLIGDGQTAMFYPPNWLFFVLPGAAALNYAILLQFSIAGVAMFACGRTFGLNRAAALVAALAFMFCGFLTARVVHLSIMSGAALIPLVVLTIDRALGVGYGGAHRRWFVAAAVATALQAVAGHPQIPVYTAVAMGLLALLRGCEAWAAGAGWRGLLAALLRLAGVYVLGYALAAIQLVPWVELGIASPRAAGASYDFVMGSGSRGAEWLLFLFPYIFGAQLPGLFADTPMGVGAAVRTWEHSAYVGVPTLALALVGLAAFVQTSMRFARGDRSELHRWYTLLFLVLLLVLGLLTGAGKNTPFSYLVYATPVVGKLRAIERALSLAAFALPLLAGVGLHWLAAQRTPTRLAQAVALVAGGMVAATVLFWLGFSPQAAQAPFDVNPLDLVLLTLNRGNGLLPLLLALGCVLALLAWAARLRAEWVQAALVGLVLVDMGIYAVSFNPTTGADLYDYQPESLAALDGKGQPFRKATVILTTNNLPNRVAQETLAVSWSMVYGIEDINGFNSLQPRRYTDYVFGTQETDVSYAFLPNQGLLQPESPILSSLNVRYVLVPRLGPQPALGSNLREVYANQQVTVYENTQVWPRVYFPARVATEQDPATILQTVTANGFDGRQLALVETDLPLDLPTPTGAATASVTSEEPSHIVIATDTGSERLLVASEMYFPGWQALIDGVAVPTQQVNYLFRGVVVPAGQHTVEFVYRPVSALIGLLVSLLAALLALGLLLGPEWFTRRGVVLRWPVRP